MKTLDVPFLPGAREPVYGPLGRYLPPVPAGIASTWLAEHVEPGEWVLDPFGSSPQFILEAARAGYRVLVAANNPIIRFILELGAAAPAEADFKSALAELASTYKGDERLELSIRSLYETTCANCKRPVSVRYFLWEKGGKAPYARVYTCPACGDEGERALESEDLERLGAFSSSGLHRARALERVASFDDPVRQDVEEALACYLARPLYALFTLINKSEGLSLPVEKKALLTGLLLSVCDQANTLWPYPIVRSRPRQLAVLSRFRENNLWQALEDAIQEWTIFSQPVPLVSWPELPPESGGICLYEGRVRDLAATALPSVPVKAILAVIPRQNQPFWTLSALWSGWLWGRSAVTPLRSALARRRYDWSWHTSALEAALTHIPARLNPEATFFGLIAECEPSFLTAMLLAADRAGFSLQGIALRPEQAQAQFTLGITKASETTSLEPIEVLAHQAIQAALSKRNETAAYLALHAAALATQAAEHALRAIPSTPQMDAFTNLHAHLRNVFSDRAFLIRYGGGEHTLESGDWWLTGQEPNFPSLSGQIEVELVRSLMRHQGCTFHELDTWLCTKFPGVSTPSLEFVRAVLESYGMEAPAGSGCWQLRTQDLPQARRTDLAEVSELLHGLGNRLGYGVHGENPLIWDESPGATAFVFYPTASTLIGNFVFNPAYSPERCLIVLPGSRSNLMAWKIRENPMLAQAIKTGWRFLKYRHLRSMADNPLMNREVFETQVNSDPPEYKETQLKMF